MYVKALQAFLTGKINWEVDTIRAVLVDANAYSVPNFINEHEFLSDIPEAARVATSPALTNKTADNGVANADDVTFSSISGAQAEAVVLYKESDSPDTSRLICYIDTALNGLPVSPNGADVSIFWDNGPNKIFRL